jgi:hypothetical protein
VEAADTPPAWESDEAAARLAAAAADKPLTKAPAGASEEDASEHEKAAPPAKKESNVHLFLHWLTEQLGGDHGVWRHPLVVLLTLMTLIGCCYGIAQNWMKSAAARDAPGLRSGIVEVDAFPGWVAVGACLPRRACFA